MEISPFQGFYNLYSEQDTQKIQQGSVLILGLGGVGSWCAEFLTRCGVGKLGLVDLDDVCQSNFNRQIHATHQTIGKLKTEAMASRLKSIHEDISMVTHHGWYNQASHQEIFDLGPWDFVIDAIDSLKDKCFLIDYCRRQRQPLGISGSAGNRFHPGMVEIQDLKKTFNDPLLMRVRKKLCQDYNFPRHHKKWCLKTVFSRELPIHKSESDSASGNFQLKRTGKNCDQGLGSSVMVTSQFAAHLSQMAIQSIIEAQ